MAGATTLVRAASADRPSVENGTIETY